MAPWKCLISSPWILQEVLKFKLLNYCMCYLFCGIEQTYRKHQNPLIITHLQETIPLQDDLINNTQFDPMIWNTIEQKIKLKQILELNLHLMMHLVLPCQLLCSLYLVILCIWFNFISTISTRWITYINMSFKFAVFI